MLSSAIINAASSGYKVAISSKSALNKSSFDAIAKSKKMEQEAFRKAAHDKQARFDANAKKVMEKAAEDALSEQREFGKQYLEAFESSWKESQAEIQNKRETFQKVWDEIERKRR